jgi:hypothetical protein
MPCSDRFRTSFNLSAKLQEKISETAPKTNVKRGFFLFVFFQKKKEKEKEKANFKTGPPNAQRSRSWPG